MNETPPWVEAYIGLGSNLDDPRQQLLSAVEDITALPEVENGVLSPLYGSQPVGPQDQPDYLNAVLRIRTCLQPLSLLRALQAIENAHHRLRTQRWGARTLDLDILLYGAETIDQPELHVPHPEMTKRAFVLYPLADIADASLSVPGAGTLGALLAACPREGIWRLT